MGPDEVIDYTKEDFTRRPERYDVIFDLAATRSCADYRRVLSPNGRVVLAGAAKGSMARTLTRALAGLVRSRYFGSRWLVPFLAEVTYKDLVVLKELVESGKLCPVIDRQYRLSEAAEAVATSEAVRLGPRSSSTSEPEGAPRGDRCASS